MFSSMVEGPFRCLGCGKQYAEYVNGCLEEHGGERKVAAVPVGPLPAGLADALQQD